MTRTPHIYLAIYHLSVLLSFPHILATVWAWVYAYNNVISDTESA